MLSINRDSEEIKEKYLESAKHANIWGISESYLLFISHLDQDLFLLTMFTIWALSKAH